MPWTLLAFLHSENLGCCFCNSLTSVWVAPVHTALGGRPAPHSATCQLCQRPHLSFEQKSCSACDKQWQLLTVDKKRDQLPGGPSHSAMSLRGSWQKRYKEFVEKELRGLSAWWTG